MSRKIGVIGGRPKNLHSNGEEEIKDSLMVDHTLSADQIINKWKMDRNRYASLEEVCCNNLCQCDYKHGFVGKKSCDCCKLLSRLFPQGTIIPNSPFEIKVGTNIGKKFILNIYEKTSFNGYSEQTKPISIGNDILNKYENMNLCENKLASFMNNIVYLSTSSFLENYVTISSIIEKEFTNDNFPIELKLKWAYNCRNSINIVEEIPSLGKKGFPTKNLYISNKKDISYKILLQLIAVLHKLNNYAFTHGEPDIDYLSFWNKPVNFEYDGKTIKSSFSLSINPSGFSSISLKDNKRLYYTGNIITEAITYQNLPIITARPILTKNKSKLKSCSSNNNIDCITDYLQNRVIVYKINKNTFISHVRHLGIPLFYSSFDFYAFFVQLMCYNEFYNEITNDDDLNNIWESLWVPEEYNDFSDKFAEFKKAKNFSFAAVLELLSNYSLRCDILDFAWEKIKKIKK